MVVAAAVGVGVARVDVLLEVLDAGHGCQAEGAGQAQLGGARLADAVHPAQVAPQVVLAADDHVADLQHRAGPKGVTTRSHSSSRPFFSVQSKRNESYPCHAYTKNDIN